MNRILKITCVLMFLAGTGCGGDSHESLAAESVSTMKELVSVFEGVKDAESAKNNKPKLKALMEKMNDINARQSKLPTPPEAEFKAMVDKYGKEMEDLQKKLTSNMLRIGFDPKIHAELDDLDQTLKKSLK